MKPISAVLCTTFATWTTKRANRTAMPHFVIVWIGQLRRRAVPHLPTKLRPMAATVSATVSARLSSCSAAWPSQRHGKLWKSKGWLWPNGTKRRPKPKRPKAAQLLQLLPAWAGWFYSNVVNNRWECISSSTPPPALSSTITSTTTVSSSSPSTTPSPAEIGHFVTQKFPLTCLDESEWILKN